MSAIIFRGPCHIIDNVTGEFKRVSHLVGLPVLETISGTRGEFRPYLKILDSVYATGRPQRVTTPSGVLLFVRLADGTGVGLQTDELPARSRPLAPRQTVPEILRATRPLVP